MWTSPSSLQRAAGSSWSLDAQTECTCKWRRASFSSGGVRQLWTCRRESDSTPMFFQGGTYTRGRLRNLLWQQFQSLLGEDGVLWDHRRGSSWRRRWRWRMGRTGGARRKPFGVQARGHPRELLSSCPSWTSLLLHNVYLGIRRSSVDDVYNVNGAGWRTGSAVEAVKGKLTPCSQGKWEWVFF